MDKLLRGVAQFLRHERPGLKATFKRLAHGQDPVALLLTAVERASLYAYGRPEGRFVHVDEAVIARELARHAAASS